jgi:DUF1365 family protein
MHFLSWLCRWCVALGSFRTKDYLSRSAIQELVAKELPATPRIGRVFLMTHWRYWGFSFNPVSYYFCYG